MRDGLQAKLAVGHALHFFIGRVLDDALAVFAGTGAHFQLGRVLVGNQRQFVEPATGQLAHALEIRLQVGKQRLGQIELEQRLELGIGVVEVRAVPVWHWMRLGG